MKEEQQKKGFTGVWIPRHIIEDEDLSMSEMIIYSEISCFDACYKPNKELGIRWGLKERRISEIISKLEKKGYVKRVSFDGRNRQLIAIKDNPVLVCLAEKCYPATQKSATIDNILDNKDIYIADKSADDNLDDNLSEDKPKTTLKDLYSKFGLPEKVKTVTKWQDEAANAIKYFSDIKGKESSVFKCFKDNNQKARIALSDCKELNQRSVYYFLKVYNELKKK